MRRRQNVSAQDLLRLDGIAAHLGVKTRFPAPAFTADVTAASLNRVEPVIRKLMPCSGEVIAQGLGEHLHVAFEEVREPCDIDALEQRYLKGKREIGFARLRAELGRPGVDALLFQRMNASDRDADRWVAVLNLQDTRAKAYWNRFHELAHRIAEPPQRTLPFRRHQFEANNPVEQLVDAVAAEVAFYAPAVRPLVERLAAAGALDFEVVDALRAEYAPSASLLCTAKAAVKFWPRPAALLTAEIRGRKSDAGADRALRISVQGCNEFARAVGLTFYANMRVPDGSPIEEAFQLGTTTSGMENLGAWGTSTGSFLRPIRVHTSARGMGATVYALLSI